MAGMPLSSGKSKAAFSHNVEAEVNAGKPQKQAVAIAYAKKRGDAKDAPRKGSIQELIAGMSGYQRDPQWLKASNNALRALSGSSRQKEFQAEMRAIEAKYKGDCSVEMDDAEIEADDCDVTSDSAMDSARRLAFDRRMETIDGHLVVTDCNISKANVCPYLGSEIPNSEALGLDPSKIYMLYRDAAELQAAVKTYDRVPLMMQHVAVHADSPQQFLVAGTVSNARFSHPFLKADLTIWTREGIDAVESGAQRELSCGYRYVAEMTSGTSA